MDWNEHLLLQLTWHWDVHTRPRLQGLTDDEYLWEPVPGAWSVRPGDGDGDDGWVLDFEFPEPQPPPVTTIAWRLAHVTQGVFGQRNANHFGGPRMSFDRDLPGDAATALQLLDEGYQRWVDGVRDLGEEGLLRAVGPAEGPFAKDPYAALVLHINREIIHHMAEVLVLRDLYRAQART